MSPRAIYSYKHVPGPNHQLILQPCAPCPRICCCVCRQVICGSYYRCCIAGCGFAGHPQCCPQWPQFSGHPCHPCCRLQLVRPQCNSYCLVCRHVITTWRYRCPCCCVDVHRHCVLANGHPRPPPC